MHICRNLPQKRGESWVIIKTKERQCMCVYVVYTVWLFFLSGPSLRGRLLVSLLFKPGPCLQHGMGLHKLNVSGWVCGDQCVLPKHPH